MSPEDPVVATLGHRDGPTDDEHALARSWVELLAPSDAALVVGHGTEVDRSTADSVVEALAATGTDVCDLGAASADEVAYVSSVLALPAVHLGSEVATGLVPGSAPLDLPAAVTASAPTTPAGAPRPGTVTTDDLTDDYVAHLRSLAPLHGIRPLRVALSVTGTADLAAPLALADSAIAHVEADRDPDVQLVVDAPSRSLLVRDECGDPVGPAAPAALLAHHGLVGSTTLFGVASPLLLARTVLGILGRSARPLSVLVADAAEHRDTLAVPLDRFDDAARAVEQALAPLAPTRRPGGGLSLAGRAGSHGEWALVLHRRPGAEGALLEVRAADATLRTALREDARAILNQFAPAA